MTRTYKELFDLLQDQIPTNLEAVIIKRVKCEQKRFARIRFSFQSTLAGASLIGLVEAGIYLFKSIQQTGFYEYASLAFSDGAVLSLYWKELVLSLVDSLPLFGLIIFMSVTALFIWSTVKALKDASTALMPA